MQPDSAAIRCGMCGAWTLLPKHLRNVQDIVQFCITCTIRIEQGIDKLGRLTANAGGAAHEAQPAASPATGRQPHTYLNPQAVDNS